MDQKWCQINMQFIKTERKGAFPIVKTEMDYSVNNVGQLVGPPEKKTKVGFILYILHQNTVNSK